MHNLNVLILGPTSFTSSLAELKPFLKFNLNFDLSQQNYNIILFHNKSIKSDKNKVLMENSDVLKICVLDKNDTAVNCDAYLYLPTTINEINSIVENVTAKKIFKKNSAIKIKDYFLNKNEKKLIKDDKFIILTEKEIQFLELFLNNKKPISKKIILSLVWHYASDADTHTVETHVYRLRKKVEEKFSDKNFILNSKDGYYL
jgi:hypothetical protein